MGRIVFISDFFLDEVLGGAEKCNDALIKLLKRDYEVESIKSSNVKADFVASNKDAFFIIANFMQLCEEVKGSIRDNCTYVIYEHDHKYISTNNPAMFKNYLAPQNVIQNKDFYVKAKKVICQSRLHAAVVYKNLLIDNIINAGGNFWDPVDLEILKENVGKKKSIKYASMDTNNKNKGTPAAIAYAKKKNIDLAMLPHKRYSSFIEDMSKVENFVFFPQWLESYSRVSVEAKILGCKIITNRFLGAASEDYFSLSGYEMLEKIQQNNKELISNIEKIIDGKEVPANFEMKKIPKITISCTFYEGDKYIKHFLEDITSQTIFEKCELVIVDANSPGNEREVIEEYCEKHENIFYHRLAHRASATEAVNMVISELATGEYITFGNLDDRRNVSCLEDQARILMFDKDISLVYGDCLQTEKSNETFERNSSYGTLYEHSLDAFSIENMIKCLPGPIPMWRVSAHDKAGLFSLKYDYANDWDMWLRMVDSGILFKKVDKPLGLYYFNPEGRSTSKDNFNKKIKEEAEIFFKYKHIFGESNFKRYEKHFSQGI